MNQSNLRKVNTVVSRLFYINDVNINQFYHCTVQARTYQSGHSSTRYLLLQIIAIQVKKNCGYATLSYKNISFQQLKLFKCLPFS